MPSLLCPIPSLAAYDVSAEYGFLPSERPLERLPDPYYDAWEAIAKRLPALILSRRIRSEIDRLPILSTARLRTEAEWQRACAVLGFFTHSYIWGGDVPSEVLPPTVTVPFLEVAAHLEITPCAPYAVTNLYNFGTFGPEDDPSEPENLLTNLSYTGSSDESWFYLISVAMEARGAKMFPQMLEAMSAARSDEQDKVAKVLLALAECIDDVASLLMRMDEHCDPYVFYHCIRPFLAGSKNMAAAGLPKGVFYDEGNGEGEWRQYGGGSNAQSSLIQFWDVFLGVEHYATGDSPSSAATTTTRGSFISEMRSYMPGPHRRFLESIESCTNIRAYCLGKEKGRPARDAYETAVESLSRLRDQHIQLVTRYIILPSRIPAQKRKNRINLATASSTSTTEPREPSMMDKPAKGRDLRGTGGTMLIPFLKQCRDETNSAALVDGPRTELE